MQKSREVCSACDPRKTVSKSEHSIKSNSVIPAKQRTWKSDISRPKKQGSASIDLPKPNLFQVERIFDDARGRHTNAKDVLLSWQIVYGRNTINLH